MVRPGRDRLSGTIEVDETYLGGVEEGVRGRQTESKALIVVAAQEDGKGIGRIRMRRILDASAESLMPFVEDAIVPGSVVHTDGWLGYLPTEGKGYVHRVTFLQGNKKSASELMPQVHRVVSLLKRWLLGTHQGAVSHEHLDYYPGRVHVPVQSADISQPGQAVLPPPPASRRGGAGAVQVHGEVCCPSENPGPQHIGAT